MNFFILGNNSNYQVFGTKDIFGTIMFALYELRKSSGRCFNMKFLKFMTLEVRFYAVTPHLISVGWYIIWEIIPDNLYWLNDDMNFCLLQGISSVG